MQEWKPFLFLVIILGIILIGCGEDEDPEPLQEVEVHFNIQIPPLAPLGAISAVTVTVTAGPNDDTVLATAALAVQGNTATGKVSVPAGKDRVFTLEAKDKDGTLIGSGMAKADVEAGQTTNVNITIQLETGEVVINGQWEEPQNNGGHPEPAEIIPGEEVAGIRLLEPFSNAKKLYGKPVVVPGPDISLIFLFEDIGLMGGVLDLNENQVIDDDELIILMMIVAPYDGKTAGGNGIGSLLDDVEGEFGAAENVDIDKVNNEEQHQYSKKGIDFTYDAKTRRVVIITIYPVLEAAPKLQNRVFQQVEGLKGLRMRR